MYKAAHMTRWLACGTLAVALAFILVGCNGDSGGERTFANPYRSRVDRANPHGGTNSHTDGGTNPHAYS